MIFRHALICFDIRLKLSDVGKIAAAAAGTNNFMLFIKENIVHLNQPAGYRQTVKPQRILNSLSLCARAADLQSIKGSENRLTCPDPPRSADSL